MKRGGVEFSSAAALSRELWLYDENKYHFARWLGDSLVRPISHDECLRFGRTNDPMVLVD